LNDAENSNNLWFRALMQSDCLYSSLLFEHCNRIWLRDWVLGRSSVCLVEGVCRLTILPYFTWPWPGLDSVSYSGCSVVPSVTG